MIWQVVHWTGDIETSRVVGAIEAITVERARDVLDDMHRSVQYFHYDRDTLRLRRTWPPKREDT